MFELTPSPISMDLLNRSLQGPGSGALVTFEGWVRDHNQGKTVSALEYQVYEALALKEGARILEEAKEKFNIHSVMATHRHGYLKIGEVAVWIGVSAAHRDDAFKAARFVIDEIKHRLPIWKKEHYLQEEPEWVFCKDHQTHVHFSENEYYQKQKTVTHQSVLKTKKVLVVGAGGLGSTVLTAIATAGVGKITLIDFDRVELSNLHRQPLYGPSDLGEAKAVIAKKKLSELNPFVKINSVSERIHEANVNTHLNGHDLIIDCTDNFETKFLLNDACFALGIPLVSASIYRFEGQIRSLVPNFSNGCLRCALPSAPQDGEIGNCNDFGVLGASVMAIAAIQAGEVIQFLTRGKNSTSDATAYFDLQTLSITKIKNLKRKSCSVCSSVSSKPKETVNTSDLDITLDEIKKHPEIQFEFVDIREQEDAFLEAYTQSDKKIVVYCHRGIRSRRIVSQYRERGFQNFYSLSGGACSL